MASDRNVKPGEPGHCGPTPAQVHDAMMRGETLGTWPRCDGCQKREDELLAGIKLVDRSKFPPASVGSWAVR